MPTACGAPVKYMWVDHDPAYLKVQPPTLNQWYTLFTDEDVRLIWCSIKQANNEAANKNLEVRWTIDGTVYFIEVDAPSGHEMYIYKDPFQSLGGTSGLEYTDEVVVNAAWYVDKRGHDFSIEFRITSVNGTNQYVRCVAAYETLEQVAP